VISSGPREIGDGTVRLREVTAADSEDLYRWRMDDASRPMFRSPGKVSTEEHRAFLSRYFEPGNTDRWFVIVAESEPVGAIALYGLSDDGNEAEWGRLVVAPERRGRGYGRRALELLIEHARRMGIRRLRCEVLEGNAAAESIYRDAGFVETGRSAIGDRIFRSLSRRLDPV